MMGRIFVVCSIIILLFFCLISVVIPGNIIFSLLSDSQNYLYLRTVLIAFLLIQLVFPPQREAGFVALSILMSVLLMAWSIELSLTYRMELLDTLAFLESGVAVVIVSLEL